MTEATDVCVIGAGVAGAVVASACVESGRDVLMLEAGNRLSGRSVPVRLLEQLVRDYRVARMRWHAGAKYRASDFRSVGDRRYNLRNLALLGRGGSTMGWGGDAYRLQPEDFRVRSSTGYGLDWPLTYDDLEPYYALADRTLSVAGDSADAGHPPRSAPLPLPARPFDVRDQPFLDLLAARGWVAMHHNVALAPDGGAFTADHLFRALEARSNFRMLTRSVAMRLVSSSKRRVAAVEYWSRDGHEFRTVEAQDIVVCGGAVESPLLLLRSASEWWPQGLGNDSGHVGRHLITHLGVAVGGRPRGFRLTNGPIGPTAVTREFDRESEQAAGKYILLWRPEPTGLMFLSACLEQRPSDVNTVRADTGRTKFDTQIPAIAFTYDERDQTREAELLEHLDGLALEIGLGVHARRRFVYAHPMCTARMSGDPRDGVVDASLRIHGMDNVYVCGSSAFSTGGAANPTMTIAALSHRLGRHLAGRAA
jgi:choline dehydrogenase-like flavoprotein